MAGQRTITSTILHTDGSPWGSAIVKFTPTSDTFTLAPDASYPVETLTRITTSDGTLLVTLASGTGVGYTVELPSGETFPILVPDGGATTLETLRADYLGIPSALGSPYQPASALLSQIAALVDPNTDKLLGWDDSANSLAYFTLGAGLSVVGTTISATGGGGGGSAWGSITGTLSSQTDLQTALNAKQTANTNLTTIAGLTPTTNNFLAANAGAWASRTPAQALAHLGLDSDLPTFSVPANTIVSTFMATVLDDVDASAARTTLGVGSGSGDVVGPSSATDNALVRFDTATGKLVQNSNATLSDTGFLSLSESLQSIMAASNYPVVQSTGGETYLSMRAATDLYAGIDLSTGGVSRWQLFTGGSVHEAGFYDVVNARYVIRATPNGPIEFQGATAALSTAGALTLGIDLAITEGGTGASSASAARNNLGLAIGTDIEAHDPDLTTFAGLSPSNDDILQRKAGAWANRTLSQIRTDLNLPWVYADDQAGADLGAKINAAVTLLAAAPGVIYCKSTALAITTAVSIPADTVLMFGAGQFSQSAAITLAGNHAAVVGTGMAATRLLNTSSSAASIIVGAFNSPVVRDLRLSRQTPTGTATAIGVDAFATSDNTMIERVWADGGHVYGFKLGTTGYSRVRNCTADSSVSHGFYLTHNANGALQWYLEDILARLNGGDGVRYLAAQFTGQTTSPVGEIRNCQTFNNAGYGLSVIGSALISLEMVRIYGGFYGSDGLSEVFFDSYGANHHLIGVVTELSGTGSPNFRASGNNGSIKFVGCLAEHSARDGFDVAATFSTFSGCEATNNGNDASATNQAGFHIRAGTAVISGCTAKNKTGTLQKHGVYADVDSVAIIGCNLAGNATAAIGGTALTASPVTGNFPSTQQAQHPGSLRVRGSYDDTTTIAGVYAGIIGTPRMTFADGTAANNWGIDNASGTFRWTLPGFSWMELSSASGLLVRHAVKSNSPTSGIGYDTGAGGTVTQTGTKATGVTLNTITGAITTVSAALAATTNVSFVVTNSAVAATDGVMVWIKSGGTANAYQVWVTAVAAGSFTVTLRNVTAGSLTEQPVIGFMVFKGVNA